MESHVTIDGTAYQIVTLDFETYYDKEYTLQSTLSTSEYIRDDRFHTHGVGIKIGTGPTQWYTGKNIALALKEVDWKRSAMLAHNTAFDGFICSHVYGIKPAFYLDTLSMARGTHSHHLRHDLDTLAKTHGLGGKTKRDALHSTKGKRKLTDTEQRALGAYCVDDVEDTFKLFWLMYPNMPDGELVLVHETIRMFCDPILLVDIPRVEAELETEIGGKMAALLKSGATTETLLSNPKFATALKSYGIIPPVKISPTTARTTYAFAKTDLEFQQLLVHPNPNVSALAEARLKIKSTIGETRAARFLEAGKDGMQLPVMLLYSGAHTHRWSGGNKMNMQNLKRGGELRKSIIAPKGHVIVVVDSAQIEARVLVWLAQQLDAIEAFANKRDLYSEFATRLFGYPVNRKQTAVNMSGETYYPQAMEGFVGKICTLGLGYGMGWQKFQDTLASGAMGMVVNLSDRQCKSAVQMYRTWNTQVVELWRTMDEVIAAMLVGGTGVFGPLSYGKGFIQLPNGLFLQYYGLQGYAFEQNGKLIGRYASYLTRTGRRKIYGGLLTENVVQALARCIIAEQMLELRKKYRIVTMTHDEIVMVCKESQADQCFADGLRVVATPPDWANGLPLDAEGGYDRCYSK